MNNIILLYSKQKTKRLEYIVNHIFSRMLGLEVAICTDETVFKANQDCKINYSDKKIDNCLKIIPHSLLFEEDIHPQEIVFSTYNDFPICFQTKQSDAIPFDIFAACFFFLSRYEEYLSSSSDLHQRFDAKDSLAYKNNFLHLPLIDCWVEMFKQVLKKAYPQLIFPKREFLFIPTYDIDLPFAYLQKNFVLQLAGYVKLLFNFDFKRIIERTEVLLKKKEDPFYTFDYLTNLHQLHQLRPCYFFIVAKKKSKYDRNPSRTKKRFQELIQNLSFSSEVGLHASYYSKENPQRIKEEKEYLEQITHKIVIKNRFHFLRFTLPASYRNLLASGITKDYSMGYANYIGYRAGTCTPFLFFDLQQNKTTDLLIYPLLCMENAFGDMQCSDEIIKILAPYIKQIKHFSGVLTTLFHNHVFNENDAGKKWKNILEYIIKVSKTKQ